MGVDRPGKQLSQMDKHKNKRARIKIASKFLDLDAQVSNDESDSQDDSLTDDEEFLVEGWDSPEDVSNTQANPHKIPLTDSDGSHSDFERIARQFRERTRKISKEDADTLSEEGLIEFNTVRYECFPGDSTNLTNSATRYLRLILIPTKTGEELRSASVLQRWLRDTSTVFASPNLCGRVYVLTKSIKNISHISRFLDPQIIHYESYKYVSNKDKVLVMRHLRMRNDLTGIFSIGSWTRFRHGLFKHDLGYVWKVLGPDFIQVAVVPRLWDQSTSTLKRKLDDSGRVMKRPPQRLLTEEFLQQFDKNLIKPGPDDSTFCLGEEVYLKLGLRLVDIYAIHAVKSVDPGAAEISAFTQLQLNTRRITNQALLSIGDTVDIISGSLCGASGTVESVSDSGCCSIKATEQEDQQNTLYMASLDEIERRFESGVTVTVELGPFAGRTGYVVGSLSDKLTIIDDRNMQEFVTLKAFVKTIRVGTHPLIHANRSVSGVTLIRNPNLSFLHKLVYIPGLCKVGCVSQVKSEDHVVVDVAPSRKSKIMCNGSSNVFSFRDVVDVESSTRLDGSIYVDDGMMNAALALYVNRRPAIEHNSKSASSFILDPTRIDPASNTLSPKLHNPPLESFRPQIQEIAQGQHVYVLHKAVKKFGSLVALNGSNHAVVIPDGGCNPQPFNFNQVISMKNFRHLDNTTHLGIESVSSAYKRRTAPQIHDSPPPPVDEQHDPCEYYHSEEACDWILNPIVMELKNRHHIFFRFIAHCVTPGNVGGSVAWTLRQTSTRSLSEYLPNGKYVDRTEIYLCYRSHEGRQFTDWVPLRNLENCQPKTVDHTLVVRGTDMGKIMVTDRFERDERKVKTGVLLRIPGGRKKDVKRFSFSDVTRVVDYGTQI